MKRRIKAILASGVWDWYPCGVACCAGDLVTLRSTNGGVTWTVARQNLGLGSGQRLGSVYQLFSLDSISSVDTSSSGSLLAQNRTDRFGVVRSATGDIAPLLPPDGGFTHQNGQVFFPQLDLKINPAKGVIVFCAVACGLSAIGLRRVHRLCNEECRLERGSDRISCLFDCYIRRFVSDNLGTGIATTICLGCLCKYTRLKPLCAAIIRTFIPWVEEARDLRKLR